MRWTFERLSFRLNGQSVALKQKSLVSGDRMTELGGGTWV